MKRKNLNDSRNSEAGFFSLELIILLIFILFITGVGQAIWRHSTKIGDYCSSAAQSVGFYDALPFCMKLNLTMSEWDYKIKHAIGVAGYANGMSQDDLLNKMTEYFNLSWVGLNADKIKQYINPDMISIKLSEFKQSASNKMQEMQYAMTQGQMGSSLFQQGNIGGVNFMQNAAGVGDYGVLSQLQLGSIYGGGLGGIKQDLGAANYYHSKAYQSLQNLQLDPSPMAQKVIASLPASPDVLMQNIKNTLGK